MERICIITDTHRFPAGQSSATKVLRKTVSKLATKIVEREFNRLFKKSDTQSFSGRVSSLAYNFVPEAVRSQIKPYSEIQMDFAQKANFGSLHRFADLLDERAFSINEKYLKKNGQDSGLAWKGMSAFRVLETRWLDPLLHFYCAYVDILVDSFEKNSSTKVYTLTQSSFPERVAAKLAKSHGISNFYRKKASHLFLDWVQRSEKKSKRKQAYENIINDWKRFAVQEVGPSAFGKKEKSRILFIGYKERTLQRLVALLPTIKANLDVEVCVLAICKGYDKTVDEVLKKLESLGAKIAWGSDFISQAEVRDLEVIVNKSNDSVKEDFFSLPVPFMYRGLDLFEDAKPYLEDVIRQGSLVNTIYSELSARVFDEAKPDLVVHFEEWEINRAFSIRARQLGVPSTAYYVFSPLAFCDLIRRQSEYAAVCGSYLAESFCSAANWSKEKISVVGDPSIDFFAGIDRGKAKKDLIEKYGNEFGLDLNKPLVLLIANYADEYISTLQYEQFYRSSYLACKKLDAQLLIKNHPQQNPEEVRSIFKSFGLAKPFLIHHANLIDLAAACDLALVTHTTATNHIIIAKTPVLSVMPKEVQDQLDRFYEYRSGAGIPILDLEEDLQLHMGRLLTDEKLRNHHIDKALAYVSTHVGPVDGKAKDRMCDFLAGLLNRSASPSGTKL